MKYYLGVDQGGTKTEAAVCSEEGEILGYGANAGLQCPYFRDEQEIYLRHIHAACRTALEQAGLDLPQISTVCASLNGADWGFEYVPLAVRLTRLLQCGDVILVNDCIGAMRGGSLEENCAVVCAGTGANIAVCREGREDLIYGYFVPPSIQGGSALGQQMFHAALEEYTGVGPPTLLTEMLLRRTGYDSVRSLFMDLTLGKFELTYSELAQDFLLACVEGDETAGRIAWEYAEHTARYVRAGLRRQELGEAAIDLVYSGSVFKDNGIAVTRRITELLHRDFPKLRCIDAPFEPVCGCLLEIFRRDCGARVPDSVAARLGATGKPYGLLRDISIRGGKRKEAGA